MTSPEATAEERWCAEKQAEVAEYLRREGVTHGEIGEWPAWHVHPSVSVWAIESAARPGKLGWWVICGDLPTDYVSAQSIWHPRDAVREIAHRWLDVVPYLRRGEMHPTVRVGLPENSMELAPLLEARAKLLLKWVEDSDIWPE